MSVDKEKFVSRCPEGFLKEISKDRQTPKKLLDQASCLNTEPTLLVQLGCVNLFIEEKKKEKKRKWIALLMISQSCLENVAVQVGSLKICFRGLMNHSYSNCNAHLNARTQLPDLL